MRKLFISIALLMSLFFVGACTQDEQEILPNGTIRFAIGQASVTNDKIMTRATPAELGKPLAEKFSLTIQREDRINPTYDGKFVESMELPIGTYNITATCGEDVLMGRDEPYYVGTAQATIEMDKTSAVVIPCRVANALVSVNFGRNAEERARFDKYYTDYGVMVKLGSHSMAIASEREASSIYFRAGSSPTYTFYGTLKSDPSQQVSMPLQSDVLPAVYQAADHGILTLTLPEPETALVVQIAKAELETVTMEQSIPLAWLPAPRAEAGHVYDGNGMLVGTDVSLFHPYPSATCKTVLTNADATVVRTVNGKGNQTSAYSSSSDWPYLNAGEYTATYYIVQDGVEKAIGTRSFTVPQPNLKLTLGGYTSYTKYKDEGNVDAANTCEPYVVYAPSAILNVSEALLAKYDHTFTCTFGGTAEQIAANANTYAPGNKTGMTASLTPYVLSAAATFDGVNVQENRNFYITGLPANFAPPAQANWEVDGAAEFDGGKVRVGSWKYNSYILNRGFAVPQGTKFDFTYSLLLRSRAATSTVTITLGSDQLFTKSEYAFGGKNYTYADTKSFVLGSNATEFKCATKASIGGDNYADFYSLILKYAK